MNATIWKIGDLGWSLNLPVTFSLRRNAEKLCFRQCCVETICQGGFTSGRSTQGFWSLGLQWWFGRFLLVLVDPKVMESSKEEVEKIGGIRSVHFVRFEKVKFTFILSSVHATNYYTTTQDSIVLFRMGIDFAPACAPQTTRRRDCRDGKIGLYICLVTCNLTNKSHFSSKKGRKGTE